MSNAPVRGVSADTSLMSNTRKVGAFLAAPFFPAASED